MDDWFEIDIDLTSSAVELKSGGNSLSAVYSFKELRYEISFNDEIIYPKLLYNFSSNIQKYKPGHVNLFPNTMP